MKRRKLKFRYKYNDSIGKFFYVPVVRFFLCWKEVWHADSNVQVKFTSKKAAEKWAKENKDLFKF